MLAHTQPLGHVYTLKSNIQLADIILELLASTATLQIPLTQEQLPGLEKPEAVSIPCFNRSVT